MTWDVKKGGEPIAALFFLTQIGTQAPLTIHLEDCADLFLPAFDNPAKIGPFLVGLCEFGDVPWSMRFDISRLAEKGTAQAADLRQAVLSVFKDQGIRIMLNPVRVDQHRTDYDEIICDDAGVWRLRE